MNEHDKRESEREAAEQAYQDWALTYHGANDPRAAYRMHQIGEDAEKTAANREALQRAMPSKAARTFTSGILQDAVEQAARFRSVPPTAEEKADLIAQVLAPAKDAPKATRDALATQVASLVDQTVAGEVGPAREQARTKAFQIASAMPRTYEPPSDSQTPEELATTLASIPRG